MRLTRLRFRQFKSLHDVSCDLNMLTLITGPNGAGKSNLVDAINLLAECFQYGLEIAVARAGGFDNIAHRGQETHSPVISFELDLELPVKEISRYRRRMRSTLPEWQEELDEILELQYSFSFAKTAGEDSSDFSVVSENFLLRDTGGLVFKINRDKSGSVKFWRSKRMKNSKTPLGTAMYPYSEDQFLNLFKDLESPTTLSVLQFTVSGNFINAIKLRLGQARVFQLSPQQCRNSGVSTPNATLDRHGANLPSVAQYLRKNKPDEWQQIEQAMRTVLPRLQSIDTTFTQDRRLALQFIESGLGRPWNSNEVSDGTVQALALFVALFDPRSPILIVEEPENALHPWILRHFLEMCREQDTKQIVLTSHSPVLIDLTDPADIRLMWNRGGKTYLSPVTDLQPEVVNLWKSGELRSFEIYDSGLIPEYLPEEYTAEDSNL